MSGLQEGKAMQSRSSGSLLKGKKQQEKRKVQDFHSDTVHSSGEIHQGSDVFQNGNPLPETELHLRRPKHTV